MRCLRSIFVALVASVLGAPLAAQANDGRDRYEGPVPAELRLFDPPVSADAGYQLLAADARGGADGDAAFRWAGEIGVALVRLAARHVAANLGPGAHPMAIFDLSAENADTPVGFVEGAAPAGRHPGGSHDGGTNLDLGYYLTSLEGRQWTPDYAACTDHFDSAGADAYECTGPPDRLDVDREALLLLEIARIHHRDFGDGLVEEIGVDARVRQVVLERLGLWARAGRHGASRALVAELELRMTSDRFEGWATSHHHHIHLRLQRFDPLGPRRPAVARLLDDERRMDEELAAGTGPALLARVRSFGLGRAIEVRVARGEGLTSCRYRVEGGPWVQASAEEPGFRHVLELPSRAGRQGSRVGLEAEMILRSGSRAEAVRVMDLPRQDPELAIAVDPARFRVGSRLRGRTAELWLDLPPTYLLYATGARFEVARPTGEPIQAEAALDRGRSRYAASIEVPAETARVRVGRACVTLSGRLERCVPFVLR